MSDKYTVIVSDAALSMLDNHVAFLAKVSTNAALKMADEILHDMESLSENPNRYPAYRNSFIYHKQYRKMISAKRYLIIYEINEANVYVDYIIDCRQHYEWLIN